MLYQEAHLMNPTDRDALLTAFSKALFKRDIDAIYRTVTPDFIWRLPIGPDAPVAREIASREQLAAYFDERERMYDGVRFHDVVYHHAPDATFMTFRVTATRKDGGLARSSRDRHGVVPTPSQRGFAVGWICGR